MQGTQAGYELSSGLRSSAGALQMIFSIVTLFQWFWCKCPGKGLCTPVCYIVLSQQLRPISAACKQQDGVRNSSPSPLCRPKVIFFHYWTELWGGLR